MRIGSLFSGIGGLDLGLELAGVGETVWQVERDPWCRKVLAFHWPNAERFDDVCAVGAAVLAPVDVIVGGFPCQDLSLAGDGAGLGGGRSGLWFEYLRIVQEIRPRVVVVENVPGLLRRGLDVVCAGLAYQGFEVEITRIRASDLGSPHRRERVFILAYADGGHVRQQSTSSGQAGLADSDRERQPQQSRPLTGIGRRVVNRRGEGLGDADRAGLEVGQPRDAGQQSAALGADRPRPPGSAQSRVGGDADDVPYRLDRHPAGRGEQQYPWEPPRTAYKVLNRPARLKALGNACTPGQAFVVGRRLLEHL